ncbi:glycosyltransferase family 2 protein [Alteromonas macleodii]|uniref:glycosyltransferase family 2 protein n=1 Tax=Alteromonas macleodii TaxID=28108 RepID=UPI0001AEBB14|nr:glycosyltransferase [Alteromonas macleodii]AFS36497.1 glycosyl transferase family protein [Alteromonas macleodii ATCC 27126]
MSHSPKISIIVPCYNHANFLPARLKSISKQSFTDFEIILLDDASSDNSQAVLHQFAGQEPRVSVTDFNSDNSGCVNDQWIKGVNLAKGKYIWIAESDDVSDSEFLEVMIAQFEKAPQIGMAYCDSMIIDESGKALFRYDFSCEDYISRWHQDFVMDGKSFIRDHLVFKNVIPNVSSALFKTECLRAALNKHNMKYCGDWYCYARLLSNSAVAYVHRPLNLFRAHIQSTRWHDQHSYKLALVEKKIILKEIRNMGIPGALESISKSYRRMFKNRHKFKRIGRLYSKLDTIIKHNTRVALYGYNDIAEYLILGFYPRVLFSVIFDKAKAGTETHGVPVITLSESALDDIDVVAICSFAYKDEMRISLDNLQFSGDIITI